jgi:hypothetical protein
LKELTRRVVGLNMIMGLGGLHASRGLGDRLLGAPEPHRFATPVQASGVPSGLAGTWRYVANQEAIVLITQQLDLTINIDANGNATGSIMFGDVEADFQTPNCTRTIFANWPSGVWTFANNQLNWSGAGTATVTFACTPSQNSSMTLGSSFSFPSVRLVDSNHLQLNPMALSLRAIESNNPNQLLTSITLTKIAGPSTSTNTITLFASVLPSSRSVQVGKTATAFATIINPSSSVATGCTIAPVTRVPATFLFQTTDPNTNKLTGSPNTPVDIPGNNGRQSFLIAFTPTAAFNPTDVVLAFTTTNTSIGPAPTVTGLNTLLLSASTTPVPDVVALAATTSNDGTVHVPGSSGTGFFAVATVNVGASSTITATANTGSQSLPLTINLCQTDPQSGQCISATGPSVTFQDNANATPTVAVFVTASGDVPFMPQTNRIFVDFLDPGGIVRGSTSVAVTTQ